MNREDFDHYLQRVGETAPGTPDWRTGQRLFNVLAVFSRSEAEQVRGVVGLDPFYNDECVPVFLAWLQGESRGD